MVATTDGWLLKAVTNDAVSDSQLQAARLALLEPRRPLASSLSMLSAKLPGMSSQPAETPLVSH